MDYIGKYCTLQYTQVISGKLSMSATTKTETVTFRIEPGLKEALRLAAAAEHRSITNLIEVLIRDHCGRNEIAIPENSNQPDTKD